MSQQLVSRSPDLKRLRDDGFDIEVRANHLLVKGVPYVTSGRAVGCGTLVSELTLAGGVTAAPGSHVIMFAGEYPCDRNGTPIEQIRYVSAAQDFGGGVVVTHSFSNKPPAGYMDYYEKVTRYVEIISHPATALDPEATARRYAPVPADADEPVFHYIDTASSRAGITAVTAKLAVGKLAVVGVGGTGSYVLDLVAKTPVQEVHIFDGDRLLTHNAFRSPGAPSLGQLEGRPLKVDYFAGIYSQMRRGIVTHPCFISAANVDLLRGMNFVFLCLDRGDAKRIVIDRLIEWAVPFVDVGMGVELVDGRLGGTLRVTAVTPEKHDHVAARISFAEGGDNEYASNIQIADLNALNAALAVVCWKKRCGFYRDLVGDHNSTYTTDCSLLCAEEAA